MWKDETHNGHGELFSDAVKAVAFCDNVVAVGINCTKPSLISPLLKSIQYLQLQKPILIKPNSGEDYDFQEGLVFHNLCFFYSCLEITDLFNLFQKKNMHRLIQGPWTIIMFKNNTDNHGSFLHGIIFLDIYWPQVQRKITPVWTFSHVHLWLRMFRHFVRYSIPLVLSIS